MKRKERIKKRSALWKFSKEEFQKLIDESDSIVSLLKKVGLNPTSGNHRTVKKVISEYGINMEGINKKRIEIFRKIGKKNELPKEILFSQNAPVVNRKSLKIRLLRDYGFEYKCVECGIGGNYNGKPITLQLDHINGIANDNRIENLRFLCPNCHSQTETYSGKNIKISEKKCPTCQTIISNRSEFCRKCSPRKAMFNWPSKDVLQELVWKKPISLLCKDIGVSDVGLKKHCNKIKINLPPTGYWNRIYSGYSHEESLIPQTRKRKTISTTFLSADINKMKICSPMESPSEK